MKFSLSSHFGNNAEVEKLPYFFQLPLKKNPTKKPIPKQNIYTENAWKNMLRIPPRVYT